MTSVEFLKSSRSGHLFSGNKSQQQSFGRMLKKFDNGKLENIDVKRAKYRKFAEIKDKIISYMKLRPKEYKQDKCGTSWLLLRDMCEKWAVDLDIKKFKCSDGWI